MVSGWDCRAEGVADVFGIPCWTSVGRRGLGLRVWKFRV